MGTPMQCKLNVITQYIVTQEEESKLHPLCQPGASGRLVLLLFVLWVSKQTKNTAHKTSEFANWYGVPTRT
jgi:hypothetical protein